MSRFIDWWIDGLIDGLIILESECCQYYTHTILSYNIACLLKIVLSITSCTVYTTYDILSCKQYELSALHLALHDHNLEISRLLIDHATKNDLNCKDDVSWKFSLIILSYPSLTVNRPPWQYCFFISFQCWMVLVTALTCSVFDAFRQARLFWCPPYGTRLMLQWLWCCL